jgi:hypothetical protein
MTEREKKMTSIQRNLSKISGPIAASRVSPKGEIAAGKGEWFKERRMKIIA